MASTRRSTTWVDVQGRMRRTELTGSASLAGIQAALAGHSNASELTHYEGAVAVAAPAPVNATYLSVGDVAVLIFADGSGAEAQIILPAPKSSIFLADGRTVDPAQVADITAAAVGTLQTSSGATVTAFLGGYRR